jgi:GNAT superfamily N-acetyltransferase
MLTLRRLSPSNPDDLLSFSAAFRGTPSYVYATAGRVPTDEEIEAMMNTIPPGHTTETVFLFEIDEDTVPIGCVSIVRGYPNTTTAYLVLLLIVQAAQGRFLGRSVLRDLESLAKSWGCTSMAAVVDSANERALRFWLREGFSEVRRTQLHGLVGQAVAIEKNAL